MRLEPPSHVPPRPGEGPLPGGPRHQPVVSKGLQDQVDIEAQYDHQHQQGSSHGAGAEHQLTKGHHGLEEEDGGQLGDGEGGVDLEGGRGQDLVRHSNGQHLVCGEDATRIDDISRWCPGKVCMKQFVIECI